MWAFLRENGGQSMVELALSLPIMAFSLLGASDMARAFAVQLAVQNGARAGAEGTALDATPTSVEATSHVQDEIGRTPGLTPANATVSVSFSQADGVTACTGAADTTVAGASSIAIPCYANVRVQYTFSTLIAWPGLPQTFQFDRTTRVRRYQ